MVLFGKCATYLKKSKIYMPYANLYIVKIGNNYDYVFKYQQGKNKPIVKNHVLIF